METIFREGLAFFGFLLVQFLFVLPFFVLIYLLAWGIKKIFTPKNI